MPYPRPVRPLVLAAALAGLTAADPAPATAAPTATAASAPGSPVAIEGEVVRSRARYARGKDAIVTESVVRTTAGDVAVRQLGGTVDGVAMLLSHAPPLLAVGDRVKLTAEPSADRAGRRALIIRAIDELVAAPIADEAAPAEFVRTVNARGGALYWDSDCVFVGYAAEGTTHIAGDDEVAAMDAVFARWRDDTASCSYLRFELEGPVDDEVGNDGVNVIKFREGRWCKPATDDEPEECYDPDAAGLTTLWFVNDTDSDENGRIFDADIEINAVHFTVSIDGETTRPPGDCQSDLPNTLTHEVGHLVGLDHTCWNGQGSQPRDDQGDLVPSCGGNLSTEAREATMYAFQDCGETSKTTPEPDDIAGVCAIYPRAAATGTCERATFDEGGCACEVGGRRSLPRGALPLALGALAALLVLRRRRA